MGNLKKEIKLKHKNKEFKLKVKLCNFFGRFSGLMFKEKESAEALLFEFNKPKNLSIHSLFVFFPFLAIWLDKKDKIIAFKKVKPFCVNVSGPKNFFKLVEIPLNSKYLKDIRFLVGN